MLWRVVVAAVIIVGCTCSSTMKVLFGTKPGQIGHLSQLFPDGPTLTRNCGGWNQETLEAGLQQRGGGVHGDDAGSLSAMSLLLLRSKHRHLHGGSCRVQHRKLLFHSQVISVS